MPHQSFYSHIWIWVCVVLNMKHFSYEFNIGLVVCSWYCCCLGRYGNKFDACERTIGEGDSSTSRDQTAHFRTGISCLRVRSASELWTRRETSLGEACQLRESTRRCQGKPVMWEKCQASDTYYGGKLLKYSSCWCAVDSDMKWIWFQALLHFAVPMVSVLQN
jgi:hypothetical protein